MRGWRLSPGGIVLLVLGASVVSTAIGAVALAGSSYLPGYLIGRLWIPLLIAAMLGVNSLETSSRERRLGLATGASAVHSLSLDHGSLEALTARGEVVTRSRDKRPLLAIYEDRLELWTSAPKPTLTVVVAWTQLEGARIGYASPAVVELAFADEESESIFLEPEMLALWPRRSLVALDIGSELRAHLDAAVRVPEGR